MDAKETEMGMNRTGIATSPIDSKETIAGATVGPISPGGLGPMVSERISYITSAEPVGSVPLPTTVRGAMQAVASVVHGEPPALFIDKLGERLAFERTSVRLYEAVLAKLDASGTWEGGPTRAAVVQIRADELAHFEMLVGVITALGADPTAMTPGADVMGVQSQGILQVVADPRTTVMQSFQAMFSAELTDNESWKLLIELARKLGKDEVAAQFLLAQQHEEEHVSRVRMWLTAATLGGAAVPLTAASQAA